MWRVALRYRPGMWRVAQCWDMRGQRASTLVKVERKNPKRKRLILISVMPYDKGACMNPRRILDATLACMTDTEKLRLIGEGVA